MRRVLFGLVMVVFGGAGWAQSSGWPVGAGHAVVTLWPKGAPGPDMTRGRERNTSTAKDPSIAGKTLVRLGNVSVPTLTLFEPKGGSNGAAVVVFPGGGYTVLAIDLEGTEVCDWLTSRGVTCVLLKYRVPDSGPAYHDDCHCNIHPKVPAALEDAQRTVGL